jgi:hypothetical protein
MQYYTIDKINDRVTVCYLDYLFDSTDVERQNFIDYIIENTSSDTTLIGTMTWEARPVDRWKTFVYDLSIHRKLILIMDEVYENQFEIKDFPVYFVDFWLLKTHFEHNIKKTNQYNRQWNSHTKRFMFLTGKPDKINRSVLLQRLMNEGLQQNCEWSFFMMPHLRSRVQEMLKLTNVEFDKFVDTYSRSVDFTYITKASDSLNVSNGGYPYDCAMYKKTSFKLISETEFEAPLPFITEKTWLTVINYHPFIEAAPAGILQRLQEKNIRTFNEYLEISNYDSIEDPQQRMDAVIKNTACWLNSIESQENLIRSDLDHNIKIFDQLVEKNISLLQHVCKIANLDQKHIYRIIKLFNHGDAEWNIFYNSVRDESWPDCWTEKNFDDLPEHIKNECIMVHGYQPFNG